MEFSSTQTLCNSITRALASTVYYDSTIGTLARMIGHEQFEQQIKSIIEKLNLALLASGMATKTISELAKAKKQRFRESELDPADLQPCTLYFLYMAAEDAKKLPAGEGIDGLLIAAFDKFKKLAIDENNQVEFARTFAKNLSNYRKIADCIDESAANSWTSFISSSKKATPLFSAALKHDFASVYDGLSDGANPNMRSFANYRINSLSSTSTPGVPDRVMRIIQKQVIDKRRWPQLFYKPELGLTNLYFPALDGDIITTHLLLEAGADPNAVSFNGMFPLYLAAEGGHVEVVKDLVEHGANVNQTTPKGCTALLNAAEENKGDVVVYLLAHGANPHIESEFGATPLSGAEQYGHDKLAALLFNYSLFGETPDPPFNQNLYSWSQDIMRRDVSRQKSSSAIAQMTIDKLSEIYSDYNKTPGQVLAAAIANQNLESLAKSYRVRL